VRGRLSWICHGLTASQRAGRFPADEPLEEVAAEMARLLVPRLGTIDRLWTSPALCARQTAQVLQPDAGIEDAFRECDYGRWRGLRIGEIHDAEPENLARWMTDFSATPHGGEPLAAVFERVGGWMDAHIADAGHSAVIAHSSVIRAAALHALGAPPEAFWRIDVEPLSVTEMTSDGRRWQLRFSAAT
jgi:broad specificity phosphatase PhoE